MRPVRTIAVSLAITITAAACGGTDGEPGQPEADAAPGVTDDSVVIGTHHPLTGPAAPGYEHVSAGTRAVFDYINDNGGVNGRTIDYRVEDDAFDPGRTIDATRALIEEHEIFAMLGGLGTQTHAAVIDRLNDAGVPDLFVSSGALEWDQPEEYPLSYGFQVDYTKEAKIQGLYLSEHLSNEGVGLLYQNDDLGLAAQSGLEQYLSDEIVAWEEYEPGVPELTGQVASLKESGADVVVCSCIPAFLALAMLESASIGYEPQWVSTSFGGDTVILTGLIEDFTAGTEAADLPADAFLDELIITSFLPLVIMDGDPWIEFYREIHEEYNGGLPFTDSAVYGMVQATLFAQVLKEAGRDLTRQGLIDALHEHELAGPGLVPFAATEQDHGGYSGVMVGQYTAGGDFDVLQDPHTTDAGGGEVLPVEVERPAPADLDFYDGS